MQDKKNQEVQTYKITKQLGSTHIQDNKTPRKYTHAR